MRLAMTMTAYSRPHYLREVLESLAANKHLSDFTLHFGVEPGNQEVLKVCQDAAFMDTHVHVNATRLGVRENPFQLLKRTFGMGYDGVLYLEDDVVLSPDAVELVLHYAHDAAAAQNRCLCLFNTDSHAENNPAVIETGRPVAKFAALGFYAPATQWTAFFEPTWHASNKGWDWSIAGAAEASHTVARPAISRSHHIGRFGGVHYVAEHHDSAYVNNPLWRNPAPEAYACTPWADAGSR